MELAGLAVESGTVVVENAVGYVRSLLDFSHETAAADSVDAAGGDEEHVAGSDLVVA